MITHRPASLIRALGRAAALGACSALLLGSGAAYADAPSTWENSPHVSGLHALTILFLIPFALFLVISLLAALPSLVKGDSYRAGQPWLGEAEWFGGPRAGLGAADGEDQKALDAADDRGGAGARF